jgi:hypothetical protein
MTDTGQASVNKSIEDTIRERIGSLAPVLRAAEQDPQQPKQEAPTAPSVPAQPAFDAHGAGTTIAETVANLEHYADRIDTVLVRLARQRDVLANLSDFLHGHTFG